MILDELDDRNSLPANLSLVVIGTYLHDLSVFGRLYNLVVVEGILLIRNNEDNLIGVVS